MTELYRGTIAFDEPLRVRPNSGSGMRNDREYMRKLRQAWRVKNRDRVNAIRRERASERRKLERGI